MTTGVLGRGEAAEVAEAARRRGRCIVFTNGCFDILHVGHARLLERARAEGDLLVVGVNDDASVRRLKGGGRPHVPLADRMELLAALRAVDVVTAFGEDTPLELIGELRPDVLVKGADYALESIVGADLVQGWGGRVVRVPLASGRSTSGLTERLRSPQPPDS